MPYHLRPVPLAGPRADRGRGPDVAAGRRWRAWSSRWRPRAIDPSAPVAPGRAPAGAGHRRPARRPLARTSPTITPRYWTDPPPTARRLKADPMHPGLRHGRQAPRASRATPRRRSTSCRDPRPARLEPAAGLGPAPRRRATRRSSPAATSITPTTPGQPGPVRHRGGDARPHRPWHSRTHSAGASPSARPSSTATPAPCPRPPDGPARLRRGRGRGHRGRRPPRRRDPRPPGRRGPRPAPARDAEVAGQARIVARSPSASRSPSTPERDAYLVLADTFDPGWSATLDGRAVPIRPAWIAFRAVFVPRGTAHARLPLPPGRLRPRPGDHRLRAPDRARRVCSWPRRPSHSRAEHAVLDWPRGWPRWGLLVLALIVLASTITVGPVRRLDPVPLDEERPHLHLGSRDRVDERAPGVVNVTTVDHNRSLCGRSLRERRFFRGAKDRTPGIPHLPIRADVDALGMYTPELARAAAEPRAPAEGLAAPRLTPVASRDPIRRRTRWIRRFRRFNSDSAIE